MNVISNTATLQMKMHKHQHSESNKPAMKWTCIIRSYFVAYPMDQKPENITVSL